MSLQRSPQKGRNGASSRRGTAKVFRQVGHSNVGTEIHFPGRSEIVWDGLPTRARTGKMPVPQWLAPLFQPECYAAGVAVVVDVASLEPVLPPPSPLEAGLLSGLPSDLDFPSADSFSLLADCLYPSLR